MPDKITIKELERLRATQLLLEKSPVVRFIWKNQDNWPVEYVSENVKDLFGYSDKDFHSGKIVYSDIIHKDDLKKVSQEVSKNSESGKNSFEHEPYRIITKQGDVKWIKDITLLIRNRQNDIIQFEGLIFDISNEKYSEINLLNKNKELEKAKAELTESEQKFKTVADFTYGWEYWADKNGNIIYISSACERISGYSPDEFVKNSQLIENIIHPDDIHIFKDHKHVFSADKAIKPINFRIIRKDNQERWISHVCQSVYDKNGKCLGVRGSNRDITVRKQAELDLKESEQRFYAIFNNNPNPTLMVNTNYEIVLTNSKLLELKNLKQEEVIGKKCYEVYHKRNNICPNCTVKDVFTKNISSKYENQILLHDGSKRYFETYAYPVLNSENQVAHAVEISVDITDQKIARENLLKQNEEFASLNEEYKIQNEELLISKEKAEENENRLTTFINSIPDIICYKDGKGRWLLANNADLELFCLTGVDYSGKTDVELADYTDDIYKEAFKTCMITDEKAWEKKTTSHDIEVIPAKEGTDKVYDVFKIPVFYPNGERKGLAVIGRDITELQNTQDKLSVALKKAEESNRLKTEFIHNLSHEIRTPMNGILGFSEFLNNPDLSPVKKKHYINIIQNSGNQLLRIIDNILEISKLETKQVKLYENEICLNDFLLELFSIFDIRAKENSIRLYLHNGLSDKESNILTDETKLNKILSNLLENALKFTNEGFIEFGYTVKDNFIELYVKDTGVGIKTENQEIIFERFSQEEKEMSRKSGGLGLGLSIAKENAELLGGKITLEAEKGKGSSFFIIIPYKPVEIKEKKESNNNHGKRSGNKNTLKNVTILIVEDEEVNYLYINTLLDDFNLNLNTIHAKHGKESIEICKMNDKIDFVLMDLKMPVMNGFEATKHIKKLRPDLPVIAQTAYTTIDDMQKAVSVGCDDFITKPINQETLKGIVYKYLTSKQSGD